MLYSDPTSACKSNFSYVLRKDKLLSDLRENCWKKAGRPRSGPLYEEKSRLRCEVRRRVRFCAGKAERLKISKRERLS